MLKEFNFESERLATSPLYETDAEVLFQIYSDAEAMKYRGSDPMKSVGDAYQMIRNQSSGNGQISKRRLAIREKDNVQLIGTLLLTFKSDVKSCCEIGFSFGRSFWGKGYGKETLKMVEGELKLAGLIEEISAWCVKKNSASIQIFQKAGFQEIPQNEYPNSSLFIKSLI